MITGYFGVPGVGKSTIASKKAYKINKMIEKDKKRVAKGKKRLCPYDVVLTNFYVKGCFKINFTDIGIYDIQNACIILDELTIDADNRDFKSFSRSSVEGFIYHRHYFNDIFYYTQNYEAVDKKIRDLTYSLYMLKKPMYPFFNRFTFAKRIFRQLTINEQTKQLVNGYRFPSFFERLMDFIGVIKLGECCYRPRYYKLFDSHSQPLNLAPFELKLWDELEKP